MKVDPPKIKIGGQGIVSILTNTLASFHSYSLLFDMSDSFLKHIILLL